MAIIIDTTHALPFWDDGDTLSCHVTADVAAKQLVSIAGPRNGGQPSIAPTAAGKRHLGVASRTAVAGEQVMVYSAPGYVVPVIAGAAISAGQDLESDGNGHVIPHTTGVVVGSALDDAAAGADAVVKLSA